MAKWLEKIKKWYNYDCPPYATSEEWDVFDAKFRANAPIRHFLNWRAPRLLHKYVTGLCKGIVSWFRYRFVKYHIVDTKLEPGYYEANTLMLHANFEMLVKHVECSLAQSWCSDHTLAKPDTSLMRFLLWYNEWGYRSESSGIIKLEEYAHDDDDDTNNNYKEILDLYIWWKHRRPARGAPNRPEHLHNFNWLSEHGKTPRSPLVAEYEEYLSECGRYDDECEQEDNDMLVKLIKHRNLLVA